MVHAKTIKYSMLLKIGTGSKQVEKKLWSILIQHNNISYPYDFWRFSKDAFAVFQPPRKLCMAAIAERHECSIISEVLWASGCAFFATKFQYEQFVIFLNSFGFIPSGKKSTPLLLPPQQPGICSASPNLPSAGDVKDPESRPFSVGKFSPKLRPHSFKSCHKKNVNGNIQQDFVSPKKMPWFTFNPPALSNLVNLFFSQAHFWLHVGFVDANIPRQKKTEQKHHKTKCVLYRNPLGTLLLQLGQSFVCSIALYLAMNIGGGLAQNERWIRPYQYDSTCISFPWTSWTTNLHLAPLPPTPLTLDLFPGDSSNCSKHGTLPWMSLRDTGVCTWQCYILSNTSQFRSGVFKASI